MKTLVLLRHIKTEQGYPDFERKLLEERKSDAPKIVRALLLHGFRPDFILCSPATRTMQTAALLCKEFTFPLSKIRYAHSLYESDSDCYLREIEAVPNTASNLLVIGHNPSIHEFILNETANANSIVKVPTGSACAIAWNRKTWSDDGVQRAKHHLLYQLLPKQLM